MTCPVCTLVVLATADPEGGVSAAMGLGGLVVKVILGREPDDLHVFDRLCPRHRHAAPITRRVSKEKTP